MIRVSCPHCKKRIEFKRGFFIISLVIILMVGIVIGVMLGFSKDDAPKNPHVKSVWDCEEGCLYSDWIEYGYSDRVKPSKMYDTCSSICRTGFVKTPTQHWRDKDD
jgi:hypothetical protein